MGQENRIHLSKETADLLVAAGKGHWLHARRDLITPKGKSAMQTYWLNATDNDKRNGVGSTTSSETGEDSNEDSDIWGDAEVAVNKSDRLIDWQVDVFTRLLKQVVARRNADALSCGTTASAAKPRKSMQHLNTDGKTCLDEVKVSISSSISLIARGCCCDSARLLVLTR